MLDKNSEEFLSNLSYEVVKDVAPEELDIFDDIKEDFLENPDDFVKKKSGRKDKALGFGGAVAVKFVGGIVISLIWDILAHISREGIESLKDEGSKALGKWIQIKLKGEKEQPSKEELKNIRNYICQYAYSNGLEKEKAKMFADSVIGKIALMRLQ